MTGKVLVTGATGFVGGFLCRTLMDAGWSVRGTLLEGEDPASLAFGVEPAPVAPLGEATDWRAALAEVDTVIHLAARVHIMDDPAADPLRAFRQVNVAGSLKLGREAARAGVRRLVFISSIKVNGEESVSPYRHDSPVHPVDPYGISKWEAELGLREIARHSGLELVVLRPPLVYGPGVKANFFNLLKVVHRGIPLPLGSIDNRRSLVFVGNLVDALARCADHPAAAGGTYLVSDGDDVSSAELARRIGRALGAPARIFPVPVPLMKLAGMLTGKGAAVQRLTGSLVVDTSALARDLGWRPPFTMDQGLQETAAWFKSRTS
jgi:nucleoside-diphosphate-sugar epimerase